MMWNRWRSNVIAKRAQIILKTNLSQMRVNRPSSHQNLAQQGFLSRPNTSSYLVHLKNIDGALSFKINRNSGTIWLWSNLTKEPFVNFFWYFNDWLHIKVLYFLRKLWIPMIWIRKRTSSQLFFAKLPDKFVKLNIHNGEIFDFRWHKLDTPVWKVLNDTSWTFK